MSKVFKGIGKVVKKVFKGVGKAFKKVWKSGIGKALLIGGAIFLTGGMAGAWVLPQALSGLTGVAQGVLGGVGSAVGSVVKGAGGVLGGIAKGIGDMGVGALAVGQMASSVFQGAAERKAERKTNKNIAGYGDIDWGSIVTANPSHPTGAPLGQTAPQGAAAPPPAAPTAPVGSQANPYQGVPVGSAANPYQGVPLGSPANPYRIPSSAGAANPMNPYDQLNQY